MLKITIEGNERRVIRLAGKINEATDLNMIRVPSCADIEIDLLDVTAINSVGIREFKNFVWNLKSKLLSLSYCPRVFIDQVNMVEGFLPPHARIKSFYVPYFDQQNGEEKNFLFIRGEHYAINGNTQDIRWPLVKGKDGGEMEIDVVSGRFFQFLKRH